MIVLKPLTYRVLIGNKEFTQRLGVYLHPRKNTTIEIGDYFFVLKRDHQNLNNYLGKKEYKALGAEEVTLVLAPGQTKSSNIEVCESVRKTGGWEEKDLPMSFVIDEIENELLNQGIQSGFPQYDITSLVTIVIAVLLACFLAVHFNNAIWASSVPVCVIWLITIIPALNQRLIKSQ